MLSYRSLISIKIPSNLAKRSSARSQTGVFPCQSGRVHRVQRDKRLFISASIYLNLRDYYEACASHAGKQLPPKSFQQVIKHEKTTACAWWFAGEVRKKVTRGGHLKEKYRRPLRWSFPVKINISIWISFCHYHSKMIRSRHTKSFFH